MRRLLPVFIVVSALILAVGCAQPGSQGGTSAPDVKVGGFGGTNTGELKIGGDLTLASQTRLQGGEFSVNYTFAPGKWSSGLVAILYLGDTVIVEATATKETKADFPALTDKNLLAGGNLVLKFREGAGKLRAGADTVLLRDKAPPTIQSASRTGNTITLSMSEPLAARGATTGKGGFELGGISETVAGIAAVTADARTVVLTLSGNSEASTSVTLTYSKPAAAAQQIRDKAGNALESISAAKIVEDATPPTIQSASRTGNSINLRLSEPLAKRDASEGKGGFELAVTGGTTVTVNRIEAVAADDTKVVLTLSGDPGTATVTLTYNKPDTETEQIRDKAGNALASVSTAISVPQDTTAPRITRAAFDGTALTLTMSKPLAARVASTGTGGFALAGTTVTVASIPAVATNATTVVLTLSGDPGVNAAVTLTYAKPTAEAEQIKDKAGNALASFTDPVSVAQPDKTAPPEPNMVTTITGGANGNMELSNQAGVDKVLNKDDETALKDHSFRVDYAFAGGTTFETGSAAVLYKGSAKLADAADTTATGASFARLGATTSLTSGTALTLKFKDSAGNESGGIKAADVDTVAPGRPSIRGVEDIDFPPAPRDTAINLLDINGDTPGIDVRFVAAAKLEAGDKVTVAGFGAAGSTRDFTGSDIKTVEGANVYKVTMAPADIAEGTGKRFWVKVTDEAGNESEASDILTGIVDTTAPTVTKAELGGSTITLTMSEALAPRETKTSADGFALAGSGGTNFAVTAVAAVGENAAEMKLTITGTPQGGETVKLTYNQPGTGRITDKAGNPLAGFTGDSAVTVDPDTAAPTIKKAEFDGTTVILTMSESLAAREASDGNGGFALAGAGVSVSSIAAVAADAKTVVLMLSDFPDAGSVTLTYTQPGSGPIKDRAGHALAGFTGASAVTVAPDTTAPTVKKAYLDGTTLTLTMSEPLAPRTTIGNGSGFQVYKTKEPQVTVTGVAKVDDKATTLTLTVSSSIAANEVASLDYAPPIEVTSRIKDKAGNAMKPIPPNAPTIVITIRGTEGPKITKAERDGSVLTLTMGESLAERAASTGDGGFTLGGTGVTETVESIAAVAPDARKVILTLSATPPGSATVTLSYTKPTADAQQIKDKAGNALASFTGESAVTVSADTTPPTVLSAKFDRNSIVITMSEELAKLPGDTITGYDGFILGGNASAEVDTCQTIGKDVFLALKGNTIPVGTITFTYTQPSDANKRIKDLADNALVSFTTPVSVTR